MIRQHTKFLFWELVEGDWPLQQNKKYKTKHKQTDALWLSFGELTHERDYFLQIMIFLPNILACFFFTRHWQISDVKEWFWTWYPYSCNVFLASLSRLIQGSTNNFERKIIQHNVWCQKQRFVNIQRILLLFVFANQNVVNPLSFMWINAQIKKELFQRINVHFNLLRHSVS